MTECIENCIKCPHLTIQKNKNRICEYKHINMGIKGYYENKKTECKICKQSWKPPRSIIYKDGMCLICYHVKNRTKDDKAQKTLSKYL